MKILEIDARVREVIEQLFEVSVLRELDSTMAAELKGEDYKMFNPQLEVELFNRLVELEAERDTKIDSVYNAVKYYEGLVEIAKEEEKRLKRRRDWLEKHVKRLKNFLQYVLDGGKWSNGIRSVGFKPSVSVELAEGAGVSDIPPEYLREIPVSYELNKEKALAEYREWKKMNDAEIKKGGTPIEPPMIPGVVFVKKLNIQLT